MKHMQPKPLETLERTVLENHELGQKERPCEWETCRAPAAFWLICPLCSAREVQCEEHSLKIRNAPVGEILTFDLTCNHRVQQCQCLTEPISKA